MVSQAFALLTRIPRASFPRAVHDEQAMPAASALTETHVIGKLEWDMHRIIRSVKRPCAVSTLQLLLHRLLIIQQYALPGVTKGSDDAAVSERKEGRL